MNSEFIGVDLGGTSFSMGRVINGMVVDPRSTQINSKASSEIILKTLIDSLDATITPEVKGIGVGVPGIVDPEHGVIYDIQNIPAWKEVPLQEILYRKYNIPVALNNDANCFALGEKRFGVGQAFSNFVGLTLGTGLGMGVIIHNELYSGVMSGAGEIGMLPYKEGIMEAYAGSFFFQREYGESAKDLHEKALLKDAKALEAYDAFGVHLGEAIKMALFMYAPEAVILGGSIAMAFPFFKKSMHKTVASFAYQKQIEHLVIECSNRPNLAILGAAALVMK
jgi:glucokinase